tara:strand:- start:7568 stop:9793 length:2226 start_codon:yes stop_codon:yes gene_type:complete
MSQQPIRLDQYTQEAYLDYAMYVILDRALPHIADGLKPVQRRIIYAMSELGLKAGSKYKKSARTIGDVIGKFHPHGDSACYEAMVLMAQDFSYRYPIIDGHGNWGSVDDPKSFAAMRYTESKLTRYAELLLSELSQGTVSWQPNFDGTLNEPISLPARIPNILLNGASGIAVGMATDIPPHNIKEVCNALIQLIKHPQTSLEKICELIKAPDFPTGADIITSPQDIEKIYKTGQGQIKQRGNYFIEDKCIVFDKLPFQASSSKVVKQIADNMVAKKLPGIVDVRDESDHEHLVRVVVELRSVAKYKDQTLNALFALTDIERSMRVNFNMIGMNQKPATKDIRTILSEWLVFRKETVTRKLRFQLDKISHRLEVLNGLLLVFIHIDEIIRIIRKHDNPKLALIERFDLSEIQAEAILEMKLRQLANLEYIALEKEKNELEEKKKELEVLLSDQKAFDQFLIKDIKDVSKNYGDDRRCQLVTVTDTPVVSFQPTVPKYPVTIVISEKGWIRSFKSTEVDIKKLTYRPGDKQSIVCHAQSTDTCALFTLDGRVYNLLAHQLPGSRGYGEPISKFVDISADIVSVLTLSRDSHYLLACTGGYGFISIGKSLQVSQRAGKSLFTLKENEKILPISQINPESELVIISQQGRMLTIKTDSVNLLPKGRGVKLIALKKGDFESGYDALSHISSIAEGESAELFSGQRKLHLDENRIEPTRGARGSRGKVLPQGFRQVTRINKSVELDD